jgi:hypothetical protein
MELNIQKSVFLLSGNRMTISEGSGTVWINVLKVGVLVVKLAS